MLPRLCVARSLTRPLRGLRPGIPLLLILVGLCFAAWACGPSEGGRESAKSSEPSPTEEPGDPVWRVDWPARADAAGYVVEGWAGRRMVFRRSVPDTFALLQPAEIRAMRALGGIDSVEIQVRSRDETAPGTPGLREPWRGQARVIR